MRRQGPLLLGALSLSIAASCQCTTDEEQTFACTSDDDCRDGFRCDGSSHTCVISSGSAGGIGTAGGGGGSAGGATAGGAAGGTAGGAAGGTAGGAAGGTAGGAAGGTAGGTAGGQAACWGNAPRTTAIRWVQCADGISAARATDAGTLTIDAGNALTAEVTGQVPLGRGPVGLVLAPFITGSLTGRLVGRVRFQPNLTANLTVIEVANGSTRHLLEVFYDASATAHLYLDGNIGGAGITAYAGPALDGGAQLLDVRWSFGDFAELYVDGTLVGRSVLGPLDAGATPFSMGLGVDHYNGVEAAPHDVELSGFYLSDDPDAGL